MNNEKKKSLLSAAVAGILGAAFAAAPVLGAEQKNTAVDKVGDAKTAKKEVERCYGIIKCGGRGSCQGKGHACAGQNKCHGEGWVWVEKGKCADIQGGSLTPVENTHRKG